VAAAVAERLTADQAARLLVRIDKGVALLALPPRDRAGRHRRQNASKP